MEEKPMEEDREQASQPKSNVMLWIAVIAIVVIVGVVYFSRTGDRAPKPSDIVSQIDEKNAKVFDVSGKPFEFSVKEIRVKKGETVKINFTSTVGMHDWVVDEFNARTKVLQAGQSDSILFVADIAGTYEYYCSVPTHRQQGMVGKLIVK